MPYRASNIVTGTDVPTLSDPGIELFKGETLTVIAASRDQGGGADAALDPVAPVSWGPQILAQRPIQDNGPWAISAHTYHNAVAGVADVVVDWAQSQSNAWLMWLALDGVALDAIIDVSASETDVNTPSPRIMLTTAEEGSIAIGGFLTQQGGGVHTPAPNGVLLEQAAIGALRASVVMYEPPSAGAFELGVDIGTPAGTEDTAMVGLAIKRRVLAGCAEAAEICLPGAQRSEIFVPGADAAGVSC